MRTLFDHAALLRARTGLGLSQEEAAAAVGVDVRTWRRYETGAVNSPARGFSVRTASQMRFVQTACRELGLEWDELVVQEGDGPRAGHVLQPAQRFCGRGAERELVVAWLSDPAVRLVAMVAVGGAGKTSLARRVAQPDRRAWAWSFYEDPDGEACARAVEATDAPLVVLDGLEALQSEGRGARALGEVTDPLLRATLRRAADGALRCRLLVTSRLPLSDLAAWEGASVRTLRLGPLDREAAREVLARCGVRDIDLDEALARTGGHALSLDVLGVLTSRLLDGDGRRVAALPMADAAGDDPLASRLARMLRGYADTLSPVERDLVARVAVFPRGATVEVLHGVASQPGLAGALAGLGRLALVRHLARLVDLGLVFAQRGAERYAAHPVVAEAFRAMAPARALHEHARAGLALSLARPPGAAARRDDLDDLHELLVHTVGAGLAEEAAQVYLRAMGGFGHLGMLRCAFARGLRALHALSPDAHPAALAPGLRDATALALTYDWALYAVALGDLALADAALDVHARRSLAVGARGRLAVLARARCHVARLAGRFDDALALADEAVSRAVALDSHLDAARGHALAGAAHHARGDLDAADAAFARARSLGDAPSARRGLWEAALRRERGDLDAARAIVEAVRADVGARGWRGHAAEADVEAAEVYVAAGDVPRARARLDAARGVSDDVELAVRWRAASARAAEEEGDAEAAARMRDEARRVVASRQLGGLARVVA